MTDLAQPAKRPAPTADTKGYPVKRLYFKSASGIPGMPAGSLVLRGDIGQENVPRHVIEYIPTWRHHRVTYLSSDKTKEPEVRMVHEANVEWEPWT